MKLSRGVHSLLKERLVSGRGLAQLREAPPTRYRR
jgi:hypothetical protein